MRRRGVAPAELGYILWANDDRERDHAEENSHLPNRAGAGATGRKLLPRRCRGAAGPADAVPRAVTHPQRQAADRRYLTSQLKSGLESVEQTPGLIIYEPNFPTQPTLDPVSSPTNQAQQTLSGGKPAKTSLELRRLDAGGAVTSAEEIVAYGEEEIWSAPLSITGSDGIHRFSLVAIDDRAQASEPRDFEIELDTLPPAIATRHPTPGMSDVPTNAVISVGMDGPLALAVDQLDTEILVLRDGGGSQVSGSLVYNPLAHSLLLVAPLTAATSYTVTLDAARFTDAAGNQTTPAPADWSWSFQSGAASDDSTPAAPTVTLPTSVDPGSGLTNDEELALTGTKEAWTSITINGQEVVPLDDQTTWAYAWALDVGESTLRVQARNRTGRASPETQVTLTRELLKPAPPVVDPLPPETVDQPLLTLEGTKEADTALLYNGNVVVPRSPETTWAYNADLNPGVNEIELRTKSADDIKSDPVNLVVDLVQAYEGPVEAGFKLIISFSLRDLVGVDPVSASFDTGSNRYAAEIWIEGPIEPGETCRIDATSKERQDIDYVATVVHYIGQKEGHTNPFHDADYRAPDYLAALVTGGIFESVGIPASADRRDEVTGYQGGDLVDATGQVRLDTPDLEGIDGITEATITNGVHVYEWLPLTRDFQRIQQGEYLVNIALHLDRDPTWVASNDTETCWGDADDAGRGQHRIVRRMGLGALPYTVQIGQASELGAPDTERGQDQLRYLTSEGVTLRWVGVQ